MGKLALGIAVLAVAYITGCDMRQPPTNVEVRPTATSLEELTKNLIDSVSIYKIWDTKILEAELEKADNDRKLVKKDRQRVINHHDSLRTEGEKEARAYAKKQFRDLDRQYEKLEHRIDIISRRLSNIEKEKTNSRITFSKEQYDILIKIEGINELEVVKYIESLDKRTKAYLSFVTFYNSDRFNEIELDVGQWGKRKGKISKEEKQILKENLDNVRREIRNRIPIREHYSLNVTLRLPYETLRKMRNIAKEEQDSSMYEVLNGLCKEIKVEIVDVNGKKRKINSIDITRHEYSVSGVKISTYIAQRYQTDVSEPLDANTIEKIKEYKRKAEQ
jgi:hypothetical protein